MRVCASPVMHRTKVSSFRKANLGAAGRVSNATAMIVAAITLASPVVTNTLYLALLGAAIFTLRESRSSTRIPATVAIQRSTL